MIGRNKETKIIDKVLKKKKADLMIIMGRRRVGKTYLIREHLKSKLHYSLIGTQDATVENQLEKFSLQLDKYSGAVSPSQPPNTWSEAFRMLSSYLETFSGKKRKVLFFDEFPWLDSHRSSFLSEFSYWWNNWAEHHNILVIICGSSTAWMIDKVINNKGGLHNRITQKIHLKPFTLAETSAFLKSKKITYSFYQTIQLYLTLGGIPYYLEAIQRGDSVAQSIDKLCLDKDGLLHQEFDNLYPALFTRPENHVKVIKALSSKWKGHTRTEISNLSGIKNGGALSKVLEELERTDFIMKLKPYGKKKRESLYRLVDEYSLFYLKFIDGRQIKSWMRYQNKPEYLSWAGYAFENLCMKYHRQVMASMQLGGLAADVHSFYSAGTADEAGAQIDLVIERADDSINLCEVKFRKTVWNMKASDYNDLENKREIFRLKTKSKKALFNTIITINGLSESALTHPSVDVHLTAEEIFGYEITQQ